MQVLWCSDYIINSDTMLAAGGVTRLPYWIQLCVGLIVSCYEQFLHFEIRILTLCHYMLEVCDYFCLQRHTLETSEYFIIDFY